MVPNSLSTNDDDEKPAKLEAETSYETVEVHYMMPNIRSNVSPNTNSKQCDSFGKSPSLTKVRPSIDDVTVWLATVYGMYVATRIPYSGFRPRGF